MIKNISIPKGTIAIILITLICVPVFAAKGGKDKSINSIPNRLAGDSGTPSGTWSVPYTDEANATDGDYSTYAWGVVTNAGSNPVNGDITWDLGKIVDAGIVTIKADIIGGTIGSGIIDIYGSQDNVNWSPKTFTIGLGHPIPWYIQEQTFLMLTRIRYIRIRCQSALGSGNDFEYRIYEIKVR